MQSKVFNIIAKEQKRQNETIELIASENFPSDNVMKAVGSCLMAKYTEGYPIVRSTGTGNTGRYYGGCQYYDELENYCCDMWQKVFHTYYHVNVQPSSGSQANQESFASVLNIGDSVLAMDLSSGSHLTHVSKASITSKMYTPYYYGLNKNGFIDYDKVEEIANEVRPVLIVAGASAYSRTIDFDRFRRIADSVGAYLMVDMAHIAGLVATGYHPSPFGVADIITTTTQKTLRGNRGGLIFCKPELAKKVDSAVFPRYQGGSLMNEIAGKAVTAEEDCTPEFTTYIGNVVRNCEAMCQEFIKMGYKIVSGGTNNHLFLLDLSNTSVTGMQLQTACEENGITLNKNMVPNDTRKPSETSGVRIGTAAETTRGKTSEDFIEIAHRIDKIIKSLDNLDKE